MTGPGPASPAAQAGRATFSALAACYLALTRHVAGPGVHFGTRDGLVYGAIGTDLPDFNRIMLPQADVPPGDATLDALLAELAGHPVLSWWVPPGPGRVELLSRLAGRGFLLGGNEVLAMVLDLAAAPAAEPVAGLEIRATTTGGEAYEAGLVSAAGFGTEGATITAMAEICGRIGERPDGPSRYFVGRLDGRPVATAIGVVAGEAVGIYSVATLPEARGRGIGRAVTLAAMLDGRERGAGIAVLESSPMGYSVYRRLGFVDVGGFQVVDRARPGTARA